MAKRKDVPAPEVPLDVWRELYQRAREFQELEPWEWMEDTDVLGIADEHGPRLVCVLGAMEEVFGCCFYRGSVGVDYLLKLTRGEISPNGREAGYGQRALLMDFVPRAELRNEDKAILTQIGYARAKGKPQRYPEFYSHEPGYCPWFIDEQDARMLIGDLEKATAFARLMDTEPEGYEPPRRETFPFAPEKLEGPLTWKHLQWRSVTVAPVEEEPLDLKGVNWAALAGLPQSPRTCWELSVEYSNSAICEPPRPYWPKLALAIDAHSSLVVGYELCGPEKSHDRVAADCLVECLEKQRGRPTHLAVTSRTLARGLEPFLDRLSIKLIETDFLPMTEQVRASFAEFEG